MESPVVAGPGQVANQAASDLVTARYTLVLQRTLIDYYVGDLETASAPDLG